jgi:hypothetical protein
MMLAASKEPAPRTEGQDLAVQAPEGVERARLQPDQHPDTDGRLVGHRSPAVGVGFEPTVTSLPWRFQNLSPIMRETEEATGQKAGTHPADLPRRRRAALRGVTDWWRQLARMRSGGRVRRAGRFRCACL